MKGLIRKELYMMATLYRKNFLLIFGLYTVLALTMRSVAITYLLIWLSCFYSLSTLALDQTCGWERYARTLPLSDRKIVGSRMLISLITVGIATAYCLIIAVVLTVMGETVLLDEVVTLTIIFSLSVLFTGMMIPASLKWGVDKARNTFLLLYVAVFAIIWLVLRSIGREAFLEDMEAVIPQIEQFQWELLAGIMVLAAVSYLLGYLAGCRIYQKKEF